MDEELDSPYQALAAEEEVDPLAQGYADLYARNEEIQKNGREEARALNATTLLTTLALSDDTKDISSQITEDTLNASREALKAGEEYAIRSKISLDRAEREGAALLNLRKSMPKVETAPGAYAAIDHAYQQAIGATQERRAKSAIEEAAIDRIQSMAARDPVQAKVLMDLAEKGDALKTVHNFNVKLQMLRQRSEELDAEYQQSGWGRFLLNTVLNLVPTNYNFARTGIVGGAGLSDFLAVGESQRKQSENLWNMPMEEFVDYVAKDGPLMQSIRDNATSPFDLVDDPGAAVEIMDSLITLGDSDRHWNNVWGGVEIASAIPWGKVATTTRSLVMAGAAKDAVRNLDNAAHILETRGAEVMESMTGVTERELMDELSVTAMTGERNGVPLAEPVAAHADAAKKALDELFNPITGSRFNTAEEAQSAVSGFIDEMRARIGRPVKDVNITSHTEKLSGGQSVTRVEMLVGNKAGFGYATEGAAKNGARAMGLPVDDVVEVVGSKTVPKYEPESRVIFNSSTTYDDITHHIVTVTNKENTQDLDLDIRVNNKTGVAEIDVGGLIPGDFGPKEVRAIAAKIADEIPEIKVFKGERVSGVRGAVNAERARTGRDFLDDVTAVVDVEKLRGQTKVVRDMSGQYFVKVVRDMPETGWLTGKLEPPQQGFVSKMLGRWIQPTARISDPGLHGRAIEAGSYLNRAEKVIKDSMMGVFKELPRNSRDVVRAVAHKGAEAGKNYTTAEFDFLVERGFGRRATEAERNAYADYKLFNDMDYQLRNTAMYLDGVMQGKESIKFTTRWGAEIDEDVIIDYNLNKIPSERVYDGSLNKHYTHQNNPLTTKQLEKLKNDGYVMVNFPESFSLPEGIKVNRMLIKKSDLEIRPLRTTQLAYSEGGHRMYTARYFVKQGQKGVQSDTGAKYLLAPRTMVTADNIAEARKWADTMNKARLAVKENKGITAADLDEIFEGKQGFPTGEEFLVDIKDNLDHPFEALFDRELPSMYAPSGEDVTRLFNEDELGINGYYRTTGRMYTSKKGEILRHTTGEVAATLDPYDTMAMSLGQVTRKLGMFNYKQNAMERFMNTYKQWMVTDPNLTSPSEFLMNGRVSPAASLEMRNRIEAQREAIKNVLRFETPGEKIGRQMYQTVAETLLGDGDNLARKMAHDAVWWWKDKNPISVMRGLAFDAKLGMFNVSQLLIQASTMVSATALSPKFGFAGMMGLYPMHSYLLKGGSEAILDTMAKRGVWKSMAFETEQEFKEYARHAYRHGFMQMNGSHVMINSHGPNAHFGSFAEGVGAAREKSRVFFYTAETWNRLVAYRIAWGETMAKGLKPTDEAFNLSVLKLADDYSMNMTHESAAFWQKGALSLPTQFWAYNQRMMDAMFGKHFTRAQRARLIGVNFAIAGTAGVPGVQAISEYIKEKHGAAPDINSLAGMMDRGIIDYINYQATGNDILIGERIGTGGWASQTVKSIFGNSQFGEQSFADLVGGATYTIGKGMVKAGVGTLENLARYAAAESGSDLGEEAIAKDGFMEMLKEISTFGNASKAMMIHQYGLYKSNKGTIIAGGLPESNAIYAALSFRPAKADEIGYLMAWKTNKEDAIKEVAGKLRSWRQEALTTGDWTTNYRKANALIKLLPEGDRAEVLRRTNSITDASFYDYLERKVREEQDNEAALEGTTE